jgi:hypothetical protein
MLIKMKKTSRDLIFIAVVGILVIIMTVRAIILDVDLDLSKQSSTIGIVQNKHDVYIKDAKRHVRYLYFSLNNSDQEFVIRPSPSRLVDIESSFTIGDTLKVIFRPAEGYNKNVFQIEKNDRVLADYHFYNKDASIKAVAGIFIGILLILYAFLRYRKITIWQFLDSLVK